MRSFISSMVLTVPFFMGSVLADAPVVNDNAPGVTYSATLPNAVTTDIRGQVVAQSNPSGAGVLFQISFSGLPAEGQPLLYHIHSNAISGGNCSTAAGHLDPFGAGSTTPCASATPSTCEVGDLSGKHGKINGTTFSANYVDDFVSTTAGNAAFMGNRSIVIHYNNKTMITCASFSELAGATNITASGTGSGANHTANSTTLSGTHAPTGTGSPASYSTGGATALVASSGAVFLGLFAFLL